MYTCMHTLKHEIYASILIVQICTSQKKLHKLDDAILR